MRCPKCQYISFDSGTSCRNCGYDFSLSSPVQPLDLPIHTGTEAAGPLADLRLSDRESDDRSSLSAAGPANRDALPARRPAAAAHAEEDEPIRPGRVSALSNLDLPLFSARNADDDRPLVSASAVPRQPLSVRRASPVPVRPRARTAADQDEPVLALGDPDYGAPPRAIRASREAALHETDESPSESEQASASLIRRLFAGFIDATIILGIDAAIVYFTLKLCGLEPRDVASLPPVPLLTFILLLNGGYFATFVAAGGQTIGKMAAGIRVVPNAVDAGLRVPFGHAVVRAAAYLVSVLPAGVGLLPALFGRDHRALHDRLADTRVVRG